MNYDETLAEHRAKKEGSTRTYRYLGLVECLPQELDREWMRNILSELMECETQRDQLQAEQEELKERQTRVLSEHDRVTIEMEGTLVTPAYPDGSFLVEITVGDQMEVIEVDRKNMRACK